MSIEEILKKVQTKDLSIEEASKLINEKSYSEMGFAKLDLDRNSRQGFGEVVFCSNKKEEHLVEIFKKLHDENREVMGTRASKEQYDAVKAVIPNAEYDTLSRIIKIEKEKTFIGKVCVCTAGTADIAVAEEAVQTAEFFGTNVDRIYDIGVSGLHRLIDNIPIILKANCVIAVAGMEGALASVLGGLVKAPVIAVPTSVGYGANFEGLSALLTMINSCANGVAVVNIDNGYGAGYMATQINRLALDNN